MRTDFSNLVLEQLEDFVKKLVFSDKTIFYLSGKINCQNVRIWDFENSRVIQEHKRDSPKVNVFCAISNTKVYGDFFFVGNTVIGAFYLDLLENRCLLKEDSHKFIR